MLKIGFLNLLYDKIIQPSMVDGGNISDSSIGTLEKWIPINFGTPKKASEINEVDAAIAKVGFNDVLTKRAILAPSLFDGTIVKEVIDYKNLKIGDKVWKIGRSTGKTEGEIIALKAVTAVEDKPHGIIVYKNAVVTNIKASSGDSGAIGILKDGNKAFGILTIGNREDTTIFLSLKRALELLEVQIVVS